MNLMNELETDKHKHVRRSAECKCKKICFGSTIINISAICDSYTFRSLLLLNSHCFVLVVRSLEVVQHIFLGTLQRFQVRSIKLPT